MGIQQFWDRIKSLATKNKITQAEIAKTCRISVNTLYGWINKGIYPPVIDAYKIAHFLGVTVDYLVAGKNKKEQKAVAQIENVRT
jgi:transcriptional regulator with XRE-family HTH domain